MTQQQQFTPSVSHAPVQQRFHRRQWCIGCWTRLSQRWFPPPHHHGWWRHLHTRRQPVRVGGGTNHLGMPACTYCMSVPMTDAKSSGAELPAAMKVAPATSSLRSSFCIKKKKIHLLHNTFWVQRSYIKGCSSAVPHRFSPAMSQSIHHMLSQGPGTCRESADRITRVHEWHERHVQVLCTSVDAPLTSTNSP